MALRSAATNKAHNKPTRRLGGSSSTRQDEGASFDTQEAVKAMLLDKVLAQNSGLTGKGVKIGEREITCWRTTRTCGVFFMETQPLRTPGMCVTFACS